MLTIRLHCGWKKPKAAICRAATTVSQATSSWCDRSQVPTFGGWAYFTFPADWLDSKTHPADICIKHNNSAKYCILLQRRGVRKSVAHKLESSRQAINKLIARIKQSFEMSECIDNNCALENKCLSEKRIGRECVLRDIISAPGIALLGIVVVRETNVRNG